jgi:hypothetical protein
MGSWCHFDLHFLYGYECWTYPNVFTSHLLIVLFILLVF